MVEDAMDNTVICPTWIPPLNFWGEYLFTFKITRYSLEQQFEHSDEDYEIFFQRLYIMHSPNKCFLEYLSDKLMLASYVYRQKFIS